MFPHSNFLPGIPIRIFETHSRIPFHSALDSLQKSTIIQEHFAQLRLFGGFPLFLILLLELIGTVAFAISGAIIGIRKNMDMLGVCIMGLTTACGGGIFRDLLLGQIPPSMFTSPIYPLTALITSIITFIPAVRHSHFLQVHHLETTVFLADAVGLGVFTSVGVNAVQAAGYGSNVFFALTLGVITGVFGGVVRDVLAGDRPYIFIKHIYACASLAGAVVYYLSSYVFPVFPSMLLGAFVTLIIRVLAAHFHWSLPKAR